MPSVPPITKVSRRNPTSFATPTQSSSSSKAKLFAFSLMGFISCISFPTVNTRILSTHHFSKQSTSVSSSFSLKFAFRRQEDKPKVSFFLPSTSSIMATPIQASSSSSTIGILTLCFFDVCFFFFLKRIASTAIRISELLLSSR